MCTQLVHILNSTVEYRDDQKEMEMKARWRPLVKQEVKQEVKEETQSSPSHDYIPTDQAIQYSRSRNQRHDSPEGQEVTSCRYVGIELVLFISLTY